MGNEQKPTEVPYRSIRIQNFHPNHKYRFITLFGIAALLVVATRLPLMPTHLYSFDSANLAFALEEFDPARNQPQPPGYPLFVAEAKLLHSFLGTPERTFAVLRILISSLALVLLCLLGQRMFSAGVGYAAAALLLVNPVFWYTSLTSPLRLHLALFSVLVAYLCWRAVSGEPRLFYAASLALAIGGGFRPGLLVVLLPLWVWTAWQLRNSRLVIRAGLLLVVVTSAWIAGLVIASGGLTRMVGAFSLYASEQADQTSILFGADLVHWRRMLGRAIIWTGLGTLPWIWTLPGGWLQRRELPDQPRCLWFLSLWFFPSFLFNAVVHTASPGHVLSSIPALCLVGGFCLAAAEQTIARTWFPQSRFALWITLFASVLFLSPGYSPREDGFAAWLAVLLALLLTVPTMPLTNGSRLLCTALLGNVLLFFGAFPLPSGPANGPFRPLGSVVDAFLGATYETSSRQVFWRKNMTDVFLLQASRLTANTNRPVLFIATSDGTPSWRKITYYLPTDRVYVLEEAGDPGVATTRARLWRRNRRLVRYSGSPPIRVPIPQGVRLIWILAGGVERELAQVVPLQHAPPVFYTDLPENFGPFRWRSFEFVPDTQGTVLR